MPGVGARAASQQHRGKSGHFSRPDFSLRGGLPQGGLGVCDVRGSGVTGRTSGGADHIAFAVVY